MIDSPPRFLLCCFVDCCLMQQYLSACLFIRLPRYSFGLAASPPRRYSFSLATSPPRLDFLFASRRLSILCSIFSSPHGDIKFSSAAVAFDWCFLPSRRCQTTDGSDDEMPSLLSSSTVAILPASRPFISWRCLLLAFLPGSWISAPSAFTPLLIALRPLAPRHKARPILLAHGHSLILH